MSRFGAGLSPRKKTDFKHKKSSLKTGTFFIIFRKKPTDYLEDFLAEEDDLQELDLVLHEVVAHFFEDEHFLAAEEDLLLLDLLLLLLNCSTAIDQKYSS